MCCQPPQHISDINFLYKSNINKLRRLPKDIETICITGGEPSLLGDKLIDLVYEVRALYPTVNIVILTNGRRFSKNELAKKLGAISDNKLFVNIELHSDYYLDHDYISGATNSYIETIRGIYNLASFNINIELRVIICRQNYLRLTYIAEFINKNMPFISRVIFMGMECIGYAYDNYNSIWIEPDEYCDNLISAIDYLTMRDIYVNIYNIPLCLLPQTLHQYSCKSISAWKMLYDIECQECQMKTECCGLFSTSKIKYKNLTPFKKEQNL